MMAPSKSPSNSPNFLITGADEADNFCPLNAGEILKIEEKQRCYI